MACSDQLPRGVGFCTGRWWLSCEMATASFEEQRTNIRFCVLLGHTPTQTHSMLQTAYGTSAVAIETVRKWHRRYREGRQTATADPRSGRPSTSRTADHVEEVGRIIREDRRQSVQDVAVKVAISYGSCYAILTWPACPLLCLIILRSSTWAAVRLVDCLPPPGSAVS